MARYRTHESRKDRTLRALLSGTRPWWAAAGLVGVVGVGGVLGTGSWRVESGTAVEASAAAPAGADRAEAIAEAVSPSDANALGVSTKWDLANLDHPRVDYWVQRYSTDPDMREKFEGFLRRSGWYRQMIARELAEQGGADVRTYPLGHFEIYRGAGFEQVVADQVAFVSRHLIEAQVQVREEFGHKSPLTQFEHSWLDPQGLRRNDRHFVLHLGGRAQRRSAQHQVHTKKQSQI